MKKLFTTLLIFAVYGQLNAQVTIQAGAQFSTVGDVQITFDNISVTNNDPGSVFNFSIITCKGNTNTMLSGSGNWVIKKLIVDKGSGVLQLGAPVQINNRVQFVTGQLDLNGQILTLATSALLENENELSRIIGPNGGVVQTTVNPGFPNMLNAGALGAVISSNQDPGSLTVKRWHNCEAGRTAVHRFYEVIPQNHVVDPTIRLHYFDAELNNIAEGGLSLYTRANAGSAWGHIGTDAKNAQLNYVEKTTASLKAQYSISGPAGGPLPLVWGPVNANCKGSAAELKWITLQEHNVAHFVVERSNNGIQWSEVAIVKAQGVSGSGQSYSYTDGAVAANTMYRIRSVDFDGRTQVSAVVQSKGCNGVFSFTLAPVPARGKATLSINSSQAFATEIKLVGADGKIHQRLQVQVAAGQNQVVLHFEKLAAGNYYVVMQTPEGVRTIGLIMQ